MDKKEHPNISVDCVIFGFDFEKLNVILIERTLVDSETGKILIDDHTLPGAHIYKNEPLEDAARRILFKLTGLHDIFLEQFYTVGDPDRLKNPVDRLWLSSIDRDPEEHVISICYFSLLNCNEVTIQHTDRNPQWFPVKELPVLAFDHKYILDKALTALRRKLQYEPIGFEMLPDKFTLSQLQKLYEVVFDITIDKRNFRKKLAGLKYLIQLNEKQKGVSHKPAAFYRFDQDIYEKNHSNILNFTI